MPARRTLVRYQCRSSISLQRLPPRTPRPRLTPPRQSRVCYALGHPTMRHYSRYSRYPGYLRRAQRQVGSHPTPARALWFPGNVLRDRCIAQAPVSNQRMLGPEHTSAVAAAIVSSISSTRTRPQSAVILDAICRINRSPIRSIASGPPTQLRKFKLSYTNRSISIRLQSTDISPATFEELSVLRSSRRASAISMITDFPLHVQQHIPRDSIMGLCGPDGVRAS